jgi:hypothetical protein
MNVIGFPGREAALTEWRADELQQLVALVPPSGCSWQAGKTERGEPQFYVLGPTPEQDCMLCVSRLGQGYVLEDGAGRLIGEAPSLDRFAVEAARAAIRGGRSFVARMLVGWCALRLTVEERLEPVLEQSEEMLVRFAPQLAAFV